MAFKLGVILVCVLALFQNGHLQFANKRDRTYIDEVTTCCQYAFNEVQNQKNPDCDAVTRRAARVLNISSLICSTSVKVCCMRRTQETICDRGIYAARTGTGCVPDSNSCNEDYQECCNCCLIGMEAKRRGMSCQTSLLGLPCQKAFFKCCLKDPLPATIPFRTNRRKPRRKSCADLRCSQSCAILDGKPTCVCRQGFDLGSDGRTCNDVNECSKQDACPRGQRCVNSAGSYQCVQPRAPVSCPSGFKVDQTGEQCEDINECLENLCSDDKDCENLKGSYRCKAKCPQGYAFRNGRCQRLCRRGFSWNATKCEDINECVVKRRPCVKITEECVNTIGSYRCVTKCPTGFVRRNGRCQRRCDTGYRWTGRRCEDVDECQRNPCKQDENCRNRPGSYQCVAKCSRDSVFRNGRCEPRCSRGYRWSGVRCNDVNECLRKPCRRDEDCENLRGSYRCKPKCSSNLLFRNGRCERRCRQGYRWNGRKCEDVDECLQNLCNANEECENKPGTYRCKQKCGDGLVLRNGRCERACRRGYRWNGRRCEDIDECKNNPCRANKRCINRLGTYRCITRCQSGYRYSSGICKDVDECKQNPCKANEECVNRPGTYRCITRRNCPSGYYLVGGKCEDIDECANSPRLCSTDKKCENIPGSYRCAVVCSQGYQRRGSDCEDIDECKQNPCKRNEECQNTRGTYRCVKKTNCRKGFNLVRGRCEDINECRRNPGACPRGQRCLNTQGSYKCEQTACPKGLERGRNGRCVDVNECARGTHNCIAKAETCYNYYGSFTCRCNRGFSYDSRSKQCKDIDECSASYCPQGCQNTYGSYKCECRKGYTLIGSDRCIDIDECSQDSRRCQQDCFNTAGSYQCRCRPGYTLLSDKRSCEDVNECNAANQHRCAWRCKNTKGSYLCECPKGYTALYSGRACRDINECNRVSGLCPLGNECIDTKGGYECLRTECPNDYFIKRKNTHCAKVSCRNNEEGCRREKRVSIRWSGHAFPHNSKERAFRYTYRITARGYRDLQIGYELRSGNEDGVFKVFKTSFSSCEVTNIRKFKGPAKYKLELVGDVISEGKLVSSFVSYLHVFVSAYEFY